MQGNIAAVTERLAAAGLTTRACCRPRRARPSGARTAAASGGLQTYIDGVSFDVVGSAEQARAAGELVGRFHTALDGLTHDFVGMRVGVHDTPRHLARLEEAVAGQASIG